MVLPAQREKVCSTSVPLFLFSSLLILDFLWISSRSSQWLVLLAEYTFRLLSSYCVAVIPPLEKMPITVPISSLTVSYTCCDTVKIRDWAISGLSS